MSYFVNRRDVPGVQMPGHVSYPLLNESHGGMAGFKSGITIYTATEYPVVGVHDDQEGFVVLEGTGWAKVGDEERRIAPDMCFLAPAGVPHCIKCDPGVQHVKVCWFHGAI